MKIIWKVRGWCKEQDFFDRYLEVVPETLAPFDKHRLQYVLEQRNQATSVWRLLRPLFKEVPDPADDIQKSLALRVFCVDDYFEDANGSEISLTQIIRQKYDNPNLVSLPRHFRQHDLELMFSENSKLPSDPERHVNLSQSELDCLAYFVRDANELQGSAYQRGKAPSLEGKEGFADCIVRNYSEEEVRSFVTIFRRLYNQGTSSGRARLMRSTF